MLGASSFGKLLLCLKWLHFNNFHLSLLVQHSQVDSIKLSMCSLQNFVYPYCKMQAGTYLFYIYIWIYVLHISVKYKLDIHQPASYIYRQIFILIEQQHSYFRTLRRCFAGVAGACSWLSFLKITIFGLCFKSLLDCVLFKKKKSHLFMNQKNKKNGYQQMWLTVIS